MTFEELCNLRERPAGHLTTAEIQALLDHAWQLRIIIDVLECTLKCWRVTFPKDKKKPHWFALQDIAADEAMKLVDK